MGTYVGVFGSSTGKIPEDKKEEFAERIEKLFQMGGMMDYEVIKLCGKQILTMRKAQMHEKGMEFIYNYFEDYFWENAGFNNKHYYVWSEKVGGMQFCDVVIAAYVLEEIYTEGVSVAVVNGAPVDSWNYVGWINYLFDEKYHIKNYDPWKLFEYYHYHLGNEEDIDWYGFASEGYGFIGGCEICAVLEGVDRAFRKYETMAKKDREKYALNAMKALLKKIDKFKKEKQLAEEEQFNVLIKGLHGYYDACNDENYVANCPDEELKQILIDVMASDAPVFAIKVISELYNKNFWDIWKEFIDIAKRKLSFLYGNDGYYVIPVSTSKFLEQSPDNLILYWDENCDFEFSEELWKWFDYLKHRYEIILNDDCIIDKPLQYIMTLLEEAYDMYHQIYAITDFVEESVEHIYDKRYQALWIIFDEMIHDPELKAAGDVIFEPGAEEDVSLGIKDWFGESKRPLIRCWSRLSDEQRNNKARVALRRYLALVANKPLRYKVFGF